MGTVSSGVLCSTAVLRPAGPEGARLAQGSSIHKKTFFADYKQHTCTTSHCTEVLHKKKNQSDMKGIKKKNLHKLAFLYSKG